MRAPGIQPVGNAGVLMRDHRAEHAVGIDLRLMAVERVLPQVEVASFPEMAGKLDVPVVGLGQFDFENQRFIRPAVVGALAVGQRAKAVVDGMKRHLVGRLLVVNLDRLAEHRRHLFEEVTEALKVLANGVGGKRRRRIHGVVVDDGKARHLLGVPVVKILAQHDVAAAFRQFHPVERARGTFAAEEDLHLVARSGLDVAEARMQAPLGQIGEGAVANLDVEQPCRATVADDAVDVVAVQRRPQVMTVGRGQSPLNLGAQQLQKLRMIRVHRFHGDRHRATDQAGELARALGTGQIISDARVIPDELFQLAHGFGDGFPDVGRGEAFIFQAGVWGIANSWGTLDAVYGRVIESRQSGGGSRRNAR